MPKPPDIDRQTGVESGAIILFYDETSFLSNVYPSQVVYNGVTYASAEQAYHASKFLPENREIIEQIMAVTEPGDSKRIARLYQEKVRRDWNYAQLRIMIEIVYKKFNQNPKLARQLIATGNKYLIEAAPDDKRWGMMTGPDGFMSGSNFMGRILMIVRKKILQES